jgi:polar amino acid transport system permease protein
MDEIGFFQNEILPAFLKGTKVSFALIVPSAVLGILIGMVAGSLRIYGNIYVRKLADTYVMLFRGIPLVVQLFIWYFGLPYIGIYLSPFTAAVIGFSLCSGAYQSEYVRGALLSIKRGQLLAAQALGFTKMRTIVHIILPQAMRRALPGCGNEIIYLIKYSSLAYMITCIELTGEAKVLASHSFRFTEVFLAVGLFYLFFVTAAGQLLSYLERRLSVPGFEMNRA